MANKCSFERASFTKGFQDLLDPLVWGELTNSDGSELNDLQKRNFIKQQIILMGQNIQISDENQVNAKNMIKEVLSLNVPSELIPTDSDILIYLTSEDIIDKPDNTNSSTDTLGKLDDEEELKERFNDDYLNTNYGKVSIAKLDAKNLARNVIIASCIKTESTSEEEGHIIQNDNDLNEEIRYQQQKALDKVIEYLKERAKMDITMELNHPELVGPDANPQMYEYDENNNLQYTGIIEKIQSAFGNRLTLDEKELNRLYANKSEKQLQIDGYHNWVLLNNFENIFRDTFGKSMTINNDFGKFTGQNKYSMDAKASNMNTTWRKSDEIWLEKEVNNVVQLLINTVPYLAVGSTTFNGNYLKFNEFCYVVCKLKDLPYNVKNSNFKFEVDKLDNYGLTDRTKEILYDYSPIQLINNIREDPQKFLPAIFEMLDNENTYNILKDKLFQNPNYFIEVDRNLIHSLNAGIFGYTDGVNNIVSRNSLFNINKNDGLYRTNYIAYVAQSVDSMFSSKYLQYFRDNSGKIYVRNMYDQTVNNIQRKIEDNITVMNSSRLSNYDAISDKYDINPVYLAALNPTTDRMTNDYRNAGYRIDDYVHDGKLGILELIVDKNGDYSYRFYSENVMTPLQKSDVDWNSIRGKVEKIKAIHYSIPFKNKQLDVFVNIDGTVNYQVDDQKVTFENKSDFDQLSEFIEDTLHQNFTNNTNYLNAYLSNYQTGDGNIQYGIVSTELMNLASHVMLNQYVSNELLKNKTPNQVRQLVGEIYGEENAPEYDNNLREIKLITQSDSGTLILLAQSKALVEGLLTSSQIKDGNGNSVSSNTLSRLLGSFLEQWETQNRQEDSATRHFSILNGILKDVVTSKEFKDSFMSTSKSNLEMNPKEMELAGFLYDFIGGLIPDKKGSPIGNGIVSIIPSVNSDKGTIGRLLLDLTKNIGETNLLNLIYTEQKVPGSNKTVKTFNKEGILQLKELCRKELGQYYTESLKNINKTWEKVSKIPSIAEVLGGDVISYNNFTKINQYCQSIGVSTIQFLNEKLSEWNANHPNDIVVLIDQVHYDQDKGIKPAIIKVNRTFKGLLDRFSNIDDTLRFFEQQEISVLKNLVKDKFEVIVPIKYNQNDSKEIKFLRDTMKDWVDPKTERLVLAKVTDSDGNIHNITRTLDLQKLFNNSSDTVDGLVEGLEELVSMGSFGFELNPALIAYNTLSYMFGSEWRASTVGAHFAHPSKAKPGTSLDVDEASRYNASNKRNVSFTAAMHAFTKRLLNGVPIDYNVAVIDDIKDIQYNVIGVEDAVKPHDGAIFVNPFIVYLENNSLCGAKVGINKKQFVHFYNEQTGTGGIIKCAGFGLTNDLMKNYPTYRNMMWNMTKRIWRDEDGNPLTIDITKDYLGNDIQYANHGDKDSYTYYKDDNVIYRIDNITSLGENNYRIERSIVTNTGDDPETVEPIIRKISSNFDLWQTFGGYNCLELKPGDNTLTTSEQSILNVVHAMNSVGIVNSSDIETQNDVYQPLKYSDIHYMATSGSIKQGAGNINKLEWYDRKHEINEETGEIIGPSLNFMRIHMNQAGIQLDKEHHADDDELSMMTQVISSCTSRGYSPQQATAMYKALSNLASLGVKDYINGFNEFFKDPQNNADAFQKVITDTIVDALINSKGTDTLQVIAEKLINKAKEGKQILFADAKNIIPYSDSAVFKKLVSTINVALTKSSIKTKIPGILSVLCPSYNIVQLFGDRKLESYNSENEIIERQTKEFDTKELVNDISQIDLGRWYLIRYKDGTHRYEYINTPNKYYILKNNIGEIESIVEAIYNRDTNKPLGRELASYNVRFVGEVNGVTKNFQLYDLDSVEMLFEERSKEHPNPVIIKHLTRRVQDELAALSTNNSSGKSVRIDNDIVNVLDVTVQPYEVIMPKIFATRFGLDTYDSVDEIKRDRQFFFKKISKNFKSLIPDENSEVYDLELKRINGKHIYLVKKDNLVLDNPRFTKKTIKTYSNPKDNGKVYRIGDDNKPIYQLSVNQQRLDDPNSTETQDEIYEYQLDNGKSVEVIATNNIQHYLNNLDYTVPKISRKFNRNSDAKGFDEIYNLLRRSKNKSAKQFVRYLNGLGQEIIDTEDDTVIDTEARMIANSDMDDKVSDNPILNSLLQRINDETRTSFLKSLDIVAARIPAQSMQSFMPMKVIAFDNPDVNTAYVSTAQIWLQGSDYDIDAVSLAAYAFDKNGRYIMWSPYANIDNEQLLKASETIPFPTGKELKMNLGETIDFRQFIALSRDEVDKPFLLKKVNGELKLIVRNYTPDYIRMLGRAIEFFNQHQIPRNSTQIRIDGVDQTRFIVENIKNVIDNHNLSIEQVKNQEIADGMVKNFMMHQMYEIINDPINLIEAQAAIDLQTAPAKNIANKQSPRALDSIEANPGDFTTNIHGIVENQTGKKGVGICAVGLKSFFALTQHYNSTLTHGSAEEIKRLLLDTNGITILGKTYYSLANNHAEHDDPFEHNTPQEVRDFYEAIGQPVPTKVNKEILDKYISDVTAINPKYKPTDEIYAAYMLSVDNDEDAALALSALLSLATDNAKELALAKLNAGTNMLGMYIYGLTIGMKFSDISKILMSDIGFRISDMMSGNAFSEEPSLNIQDVFDYFEIGPTKYLSQFDKFSFDEKNKRRITSPTVIFSRLLKTKLGIKERGFTTRDLARALQKLSISDATLEEKLKIIDEIRNDKINSAFGENKALAQRMYDFAEEYIQQQQIRLNDDIEGFNAYNQIKKLSEGAEEMKTLGQLLHINQGLYTSISESIDLIDRIENVIETRKYAIYKELKRQYPDGYPTRDGGKRPIRLNQKNGIYNLNGKSVNLSKDTKFNLHSFLYDDTYREEYISLYDDYKSTFNLLDVVSGVPHFFEYLKIADMSHQSIMKTSSKYRAIYNLGKPVIEAIGARSTVDRQNVLKKLENFANDYLRRDFCLKTGITIRIPEGQYYYKKGDVPEIISDGNEYVDIWGSSTLINGKEGILVQLGTREGDASFKRFMEHKVIPDLKRGFDGKSYKEFLKSNEFIKGLQPSVFTNTPNYTSILGFSLPINMSPRSDQEKALLDKYRQSFNELKSSPIKYNVGMNSYDLVELFFLYNQIAYQGRVGENTLTNIFQESQDYGIIDDYRAFINDFDMTNDIILDQDVTLQELVAWCSPKANPRSTNLNTFYYLNQNTGRMAFWSRAKEDSDVDSEFGINSGNVNGYSPSQLSIDSEGKQDLFFVENYSSKPIIKSVTDSSDGSKHTIEIDHIRGSIKTIKVDNKEIEIPITRQIDFEKIPTKLVFDVMDKQLHSYYDIDKLYDDLNSMLKCHH